MQTLAGFLFRFGFFATKTACLSLSCAPLVRLLIVISVLSLNDLCLSSSSYRFDVFERLTSPGTFLFRDVNENGRKVTNQFFSFTQIELPPSTRYTMPMWMDRNDYYRLAWSMLLLFLNVDFVNAQKNLEISEFQQYMLSTNFSLVVVVVVVASILTFLSCFGVFYLLLSINMLTWELQFTKRI